MGFYSMVAQMLPVLLLVAAVEGGYFRERDGEESFNRFVIRAFWFGGLLGIAASLAVVARDSDSVLLRGVVLYSLGLVGIFVSVYALHGPARDVTKSKDPDDA
jgi:hypothetical protein